jgi:hypothetical protein
MLIKRPAWRREMGSKSRTNSTQAVKQRANMEFAGEMPGILANGERELPGMKCRANGNRCRKIRSERSV